MLHNVPSLLDETNARRHEYFYFTERKIIIEWVNASGRDEVKKRTRLFYEPIWREMEPLVLALLE